MNAAQRPHVQLEPKPRQYAKKSFAEEWKTFLDVHGLHEYPD
jgi:hypothetical protein